MCKEHTWRNTRHWRVIPVFQLKPHAHSNMDNAKHWTQMQFCDCSPKSCITARCFSGSSAWMELWVTMWHYNCSPGTAQDGSTRAFKHQVALGCWFGNRLKQIQMHTSTSSAFPSSGRSLKDFLEGLGRDMSPAVTDMKCNLGFTSLRL